MGQSSVLGDGSLISATSFFEKKFKEKSGLSWKDRLAAPRPGKYMFIERNYEEDSSSEEENDEKPQKTKKGEQQKEEKKAVESTLPAQVQSLLSFIFDQQYFLSAMADMSYDANKLPLGKLSKRTLQTGFQILKDLSELVADPALAMSKYGTGFVPATEQLSNRYFSTIPHAFGRNRPPVVRNEELIKREVVLLESLMDMGIANEILKSSSKEADSIHPLDKQFQGLGLEEMTPCRFSSARLNRGFEAYKSQVDKKSTEFKELQDYLLKTQGHTHSIRCKVTYS
jgi:poly [ADP-ribose] polymerase